MSDDPQWDLIDLPAAEDAAAQGVTSGSVVAKAWSAAGDCSVSVTRDAASGWLAVVVRDEVRDVGRVTELIEPQARHVQLVGSIADDRGSSPRLHYAVARTADGSQIRLQGEGAGLPEQLATGAWSLSCRRVEDFFAEVPAEVSTESGAWEPLAAS